MFMSLQAKPPLSFVLIGQTFLCPLYFVISADGFEGKMKNRNNMINSAGQSLEKGGSESPATGAGKSSPRGLIFSPQLAVAQTSGLKIRPLGEEFPAPVACILPSVRV